MTTPEPWLSSWRVRVGGVLALLHLLGRLSVLALVPGPFLPGALALPFVSLVGVLILALIIRHLEDQEDPGDPGDLNKSGSPLRVLGKRLEASARPEVLRLTRPRFQSLSLLIPIFSLCAEAYRPALHWLGTDDGALSLITGLGVFALLLILMLSIAYVLLSLVWRLDRLIKSLPKDAEPGS